MKDKKLEELFNGYFEGTDTPDISITEDAKKFVKKPSVLPRFAKIASIAASAVLCVTAAVLITVNVLPSAPSAPPASDADNSGAADEQISVYGDGDFSTAGVSAYTASKIDPSLKFIERLSLSPNANVTLSKAEFNEGGLAFVKAEAAFITQTRYDAEVFVEFTDKVYSPLAEYRDGEKGYFRGTEYALTREIAENGEPVNKLFVESGGVKYYFNVISTDPDAYLACLQLIK